MLDPDLFAEMMEYINKSYPEWRGDIESKEFMAHWYDRFKEFEDEKFKKRVVEYADEVGLRPNVARLKNYIKGQSNFAKNEKHKGLKNFRRA